MFRFDHTKIKEFDHTADTGILVSGETLPALFANLAFGMLSLITTDLNQQENHNKFIELKASSLTDLIIAWLSEINYILQVEHFLVTGIEVKSFRSTPDMVSISAVLLGCDSRHYENDFKTEIKAVTYHQLECEQKEDEYVARVIFDI